MKKSVLLIILVVNMIGFVVAQDILPIRIGVSVLAAGYEGINFEYASPFDSSSLGLEIGLGSRMPVFERYIATELAVRYYPFNRFARGLYLSPSYTLTIDRERTYRPTTHSMKICGGYRFIIFKHITFYLGIGYLYEYQPWRFPGDVHAHLVATELGIGGAFKSRN